MPVLFQAYSGPEYGPMRLVDGVLAPTQKSWYPCIESCSPVDDDSPWPNAFILHPRRAARTRYKPPTTRTTPSGWGLDDDAFWTDGLRIVAFA